MKIFATLAMLAASTSVDSVVEFGKTGGTASLHLRSGSTFMIRMATNPTTGFDWHELASSIPECVTEMSRTYEKSGSGLVGAPTTLTLMYSVIGECEGELVFGYSRAWEKSGSDSIPYVRVHVLVSDGIEL